MPLNVRLMTLMVMMLVVAMMMTVMMMALMSLQFVIARAFTGSCNAREREPDGQQTTCINLAPCGRLYLAKSPPPITKDHV